MTQRLRARLTLCLDLHRADESALADSIATLKANRTFATTVRDGIRLMVDLRAGRTDVLFTFFPWIRDSIQPTPSAEFNDILRQMQELKPPQDSLEIPSKRPATSGVVLVEGSGKGSAETVARNFLASMGSLASGFFD